MEDSQIEDKKKEDDAEKDPPEKRCPHRVLSAYRIGQSEKWMDQDRYETIRRFWLSRGVGGFEKKGTFPISEMSPFW